MIIARLISRHGARGTHRRDGQEQREHQNPVLAFRQYYAFHVRQRRDFRLAEVIVFEGLIAARLCIQAAAL
jgi:hypothetical protein